MFLKELKKTVEENVLLEKNGVCKKHLFDNTSLYSKKVITLVIVDPLTQRNLLFLR